MPRIPGGKRLRAKEYSDEWMVSMSLKVSALSGGLFSFVTVTPLTAKRSEKAKIALYIDLSWQKDIGMKADCI